MSAAPFNTFNTEVNQCPLYYAPKSIYLTALLSKAPVKLALEIIHMASSDELLTRTDIHMASTSCLLRWANIEVYNNTIRFNENNKVIE